MPDSVNHNLNRVLRPPLEAIKPPTPPTTGATDSPSFKDIMNAAVSKVNDLQQDSDKAVEALVTGKAESIDEVMMAVEKADLAFRSLLAVRNKLVDAYKEISRMPV